ncbi:MAG: hypothetical protein M1820_005515 [Bogoriella megaspora]|nr:MAG: hypothetical protein M1820_005515 [Bogoriella megaspora]
MDSSKIPNLNTLRTGRGRGGGLRGRALRSHQDVEVSKEAKDKIVQNTDQDAAQSRLSAVELGYLDDPFAKAFVSERGPRRFPIINRGMLQQLPIERTYVRTTAIDHLVHLFLSQSPSSPKQIISLGAGTDTRYFRLLHGNPSLQSTLIYHELDFPSSTTSKIHTILTTPALRSFLPSLTQPTSLSPSDSSTLHTPNYNIHPLDLRTLTSPYSLPSLPNLRNDIPTLLLSECCLIYLPPSLSTSILRTFTQHLLPTCPLSLILYEPIRPHDPFGRTMVSNLLQRGIVLESLETYAGIAEQKQRLRDVRLSDGVGGMDVLGVWKKWVGEGEKERVGRCEMLDEVEEWELLAEHYCVCWGWRDGEDGDERGIFGEAWGGLEGRDG